MSFVFYLNDIIHRCIVAYKNIIAAIKNQKNVNEKYIVEFDIWKYRKGQKIKKNFCPL